MLLLLACAAPVDSSPDTSPVTPEPIHLPTIQVDRGDCNHAPDVPWIGGSVLVTTCTPDGRCINSQQWISGERIHFSSCTGGTSWEILQIVP